MSLALFLSNYKQKNISCNIEKRRPSYDIREALGIRPLASLGVTEKKWLGATEKKWLGVTEKKWLGVTEKKMARGDRKKMARASRKMARGDSPTLSCRAVARHPPITLSFRA
jgi:hypothetical protein